MAFDSGSLSFRIFWVRDKVRDSLLGAFHEAALPPIETLSTSPISGWTGWRHMLDDDLTPENCYFQPWIHVLHVKAERKIPKPLLRAYCKKEEESVKRSRGLEFLPARIRKEIKENVTESLLPDMPPTLSGFGAVLNTASHLIYAEATKKSSQEVFARAFADAAGQGVALYNAQTAAMARRQKNAVGLPPALFTDLLPRSDAEEAPLGHEFLTWLWFTWEERGNDFVSRIGENCQFSLDGPVTFSTTDTQAQNVAISNGLPLRCREAGSALVCGKLVGKVSLTIADSEKSWTASVGADFSIRGLKLPKEDAGDSEGGAGLPSQRRAKAAEKAAGPQPFQERMTLIDKFVDLLLQLYDAFIDERFDAAAWEKTEAEMKAWALARSKTDEFKGLRARKAAEKEFLDELLDDAPARRSRKGNGK